MLTDLFFSACIGHKAPLYIDDLSTNLVGPACEHKDDQNQSYLVRDDWAGDAFNGRFLSEYCQLFWLERFLSRRPTVKFLVISQYRKFLGVLPGSRVAENTPYVFVTRPADAHIYCIKPEYIEALDLNDKAGLHGPILKVGPLIQNYARFHVLEDFLLFSNAILKSHCFMPEKVAEFTTFNYLIPAPSLGIHLIDDFLSDMVILRTVWSEYYKSSFTERSGYQRRVGGFLLERLHSFLVLDRLKSYRTRFIQGHQFIVLTEGAYAYPTI